MWCEEQVLNWILCIIPTPSFSLFSLYWCYLESSSWRTSRKDSFRLCSISFSWCCLPSFVYYSTMPSSLSSSNSWYLESSSKSISLCLIGELVGNSSRLHSVSFSWCRLPHRCFFWKSKETENALKYCGTSKAGSLGWVKPTKRLKLPMFACDHDKKDINNSKRLILSALENIRIPLPILCVSLMWGHMPDKPTLLRYLFLIPFFCDF